MAGVVMRATLKATEAKQFSLQDRISGTLRDEFIDSLFNGICFADPTSLADVSAQLEDDENLSAGFVPTSKNPSHMTLLKDYYGVLAAADNPTPAGRASSFISLNGSKVQVEFDIIGRRLKRRVLEAVARERFGDDSVRIIRLLLETGKMDEKQVRYYFL